MAYKMQGSFEAKYVRTKVEFIGGYQEIDDFFDKTKAYPGTIINAGWETGTNIPSEVVPRKAQVINGGRIYDYLVMMGGATLVSERFKACVESLDKRHQFFPVEVEEKNGEPKPDQYYMFNVVGQIEAIVEEQSNFKATGRDGISNYWYYARKVGPFRCAVDRAIIGDRACWTDLRYYKRWLISDALADLLRQQKLQGFDLDDHCDEVAV